jgi:hypothetical protein
VLTSLETGGNYTASGTVTTYSTEDIIYNFSCFMAGTEILLASGGLANVEALAVGDLVRTSDGRSLPVLWVGRQTVCLTFADELRALPIRIKAGSLDENLPVRDLLVSPAHAIKVGDILVQAGALVNGSSIEREANVPNTFIYYHVELEDHALLIAEGVPAESFVDNARRENFDNWAQHEALFPQGHSIEELSLPRAQSARQVPMAIRQRLAARATAIAEAIAQAA